MITVTLNNKPLTLPAMTTLAAALEAQGITPAGKAVALNDTAIPPDLWPQTILHDNDSLTIFRAFYGG